MLTNVTFGGFTPAPYSSTVLKLEHLMLQVLLHFSATLAWLEKGASCYQYTIELADEAEKASVRLNGFISYRAANSSVVFSIPKVFITVI